MSTVSARWERHLLNVGCARELGATFTKCQLCMRAGRDIYLMSAVSVSWEQHLLNVDCVRELGATFTKCRLLMIDSQAIFSKYRLFHEKFSGF